MFFLATKGLHLSIEFTGGTLMEVSYAQAPDLDKIRKQLESDGFADTQVQNFGSSRDVLIRVPLAKDTETAKVGERVMASLARAGGGDAPQLKRVEFVGPQVGKELAEDGALALLLVVIGIVIYLAIRFEWRFAVSAIIANLHDVVIILGFFAFFQWEFSLPVLAAVLAVLGYSVNESVVVFDRVRETFKKKRGLTTPEVLDHAITSTISRTIITHGCTQMMVTSMLIFGGAAAALLRPGADHRHPVRHLLLGAGGQPAGDVAGRLARAVHQGEEGQARRHDRRRRLRLINAPTPDHGRRWRRPLLATGPAARRTTRAIAVAFQRARLGGPM